PAGAGDPGRPGQQRPGAVCRPAGENPALRKRPGGYEKQAGFPGGQPVRGRPG
ncbi:MAG TPA: RNA pseudouridine synthase, partial [Clostridiales bacterium]|nr:RNA pseudouridine synthase [Clostridiales bacterium]